MSLLRDDGTTLRPLPPLVTPVQLGRIYPLSPPEHRIADAWAISAACRAAGITKLSHLAMLLGQMGHESYQLRYVREVWGPTPIQRLYERSVDAPWGPVGVNRKAFKLGNAAPGDGFTLRGWGWLQVTGFANTLSASLRIFGDARLVQRRELLDDRRTGALGAVDYWSARGLGTLVDAGQDLQVTIAINGGTTEHLRRMMLRDRAVAVLKESP